jgi:hypothetical protein
MGVAHIRDVVGDRRQRDGGRLHTDVLGPVKFVSRAMSRRALLGGRSTAPLSAAQLPFRDDQRPPARCRATRGVSRPRRE